MAPKEARLENCVQCKGGKPDLYCPGCLGRFYHTECFEKAKRHRPDRDASLRGHEKVPIGLLRALDYINWPNEQTNISREDIDSSKQHQFIRMDEQNYTLTFGPRAIPLLRPPPVIQAASECATSSAPQVPDDATSADHLSLQDPPITDHGRRPGFISFLGDTGTGKSWILRSLLRKFPKYPAPLSSPGKQTNVVASTSSGINLYADGESAFHDDPILFLDFEGLNGTDLPCTYALQQEPSALSDHHLKMLISRRQHYAESIYPRLAYAFSDCIVFVTTNTMQSREAVAKMIASFVNAAHGARFQTFKPALIIVYNKYSNNDDDWSDEASTAAFLNPTSSSEQRVKELRYYFNPIRVIKIPPCLGTLGHISVAQIDKLGELLREEYRLARTRRVQSDMHFESSSLLCYLSSALHVYSQLDAEPVFDWVTATRRHPPATRLSSRTAALISFWRYTMASRSRHHSPVESFKRASTAFRSRLKFFVHLYIYRHNLSALQGYRDFAADFQNFRARCAELDIPCGDNPCGGTRGRHRPDVHEDRDGRRWPGAYTPALHLELVDLMPPLTNDDYTILTALDLPEPASTRDYFPTENCSGCLLLPIATTLSCRHPFCEPCVREMMGLDQALHLLPTIRCLFCSDHRTFSPRFLPAGAGYRILVLNAIELRVISPTKMLQSLEKECFSIPVRYLFDFFIGADTGASLALAVGSTHPSMSLGLGGLEGRFRAMDELEMVWSSAETEEKMRRLLESHDKPVGRADSCPHVAVVSWWTPKHPVYAHCHQGSQINDLHQSCTTANGTRILAEKGVGEAASLWPMRALDILVVLSSEGWSPGEVELPGLWSPYMTEWVEGLCFKVTPTIFDLKPLKSDDCDYFGYDVARIGYLTERWLERQHDTIMVLSNHLIAGLFFYNDLFLTHTLNRQGKICCRLPWDLGSRESMVARLTEVARSDILFVATCAGVQTEIDALPALENLCQGQELIIHVDMKNLPATEEHSRVKITMADIFGKSDKRYPISGCS